MAPSSNKLFGCVAFYLVKVKNKIKIKVEREDPFFYLSKSNSPRHPLAECRIAAAQRTINAHVKSGRELFREHTVT
jgi:hypothetical protein